MCNDHWNLSICAHDSRPHFVQRIASNRSKTGLLYPVPKVVPHKLKTEFGECFAERMEEDKEWTDAKHKRKRVLKKEARRRGSRLELVVWKQVGHGVVIKYEVLSWRNIMSVIHKYQMVYFSLCFRQPRNTSPFNGVL